MKFFCVNSGLIYASYLRFDLQTAENQRMQQHVTSLKADNSRLHRKLVCNVGHVCFTVG